MNLDALLESTLRQADERTGHRVLGELGRARVRVAAEDVWTLTTIADSLAPYVRFVDERDAPRTDADADGAVRVAVLDDAELAAAICARPEWSQGVPIRMYGTLTATRLDLGSDYALVSVPDFGSVSIWSGVERRLVLLRSGGQLDRHLLDHHVKLPLKQSLRIHGYAAIHCSAVEIDGQAIVFTGSQGAGKSTILVAMLEQGAHHLAGDIAYIDTRSEPARVLGWPHPIRFGAGTVGDSPLLQRIATADRGVERVIRMSSAMARDGKWELHVAHLEALFGPDVLATSARLGPVIVPQLTLSREDARGRWTDDAAIRLRVRRQLLEERPGHDWLMTVDESELAEADQANAANVVSRFDRFGVLGYGTAATAPAKEVERLLASAQPEGGR